MTCHPSWLENDDDEEEEQKQNNFDHIRTGSRIDVMNPFGIWNRAVVDAVAMRRLHVSYEMLPATYAEWLPLDSKRIARFRTMV